mmetsp:Transcript_66618/g.182703  ORF Transcript_66618/g.182703 Transcript_66618/m.182703 type:complete len:203 (+) Transcript_66618:212-820(+)
MHTPGCMHRRVCTLRINIGQPKDPLVWRHGHNTTGVPSRGQIHQCHSVWEGCSPPPGCRQSGLKAPRPIPRRHCRRALRTLPRLAPAPRTILASMGAACLVSADGCYAAFRSAHIHMLAPRWRFCALFGASSSSSSPSSSSSSSSSPSSSSASSGRFNTTPALTICASALASTVASLVPSLSPTAGSTTWLSCDSSWCCILR